jgi:dienelactone hydrolase
MKRLPVLLALALISASPAAPHYHWYPAKADTKPRPWAIIFPRAMGIGKLVPGNQYVSFAEYLNRHGIDALVIDDDQAAKRVKASGNTGAKLAALAKDALADARDKGRMDMRCPGIVVGWSRGGEGALTLASTAEGGKTGIKAAIGYYPSVRGQPQPWPQLHPVLALQGTADTLAPAASLQKLAATRTPQSILFTIKLFTNARHRFDVTRPGDQSYDPGVMPKDHDPVASSVAFMEITSFLKAQGISGQSCALD